MNQDDMNCGLELTVGCLMVMASVVVTVACSAAAVMLIGRSLGVW